MTTKLKDMDVQLDKECMPLSLTTEEIVAKVKRAAAGLECCLRLNGDSRVIDTAFVYWNSIQKELSVYMFTGDTFIVHASMHI